MIYKHIIAHVRKKLSHFNQHLKFGEIKVWQIIRNHQRDQSRDQCGRRRFDKFQLAHILIGKGKLNFGEQFTKLKPCQTFVLYSIP